MNKISYCESELQAIVCIYTTANFKLQANVFYYYNTLKLVFSKNFIHLSFQMVHDSCRQQAN